MSIFQIILGLIPVGGIFIAIGLFKGKINQNTETNKTQDEQIKQLASKQELSSAVCRLNEQITVSIKRSDEILAMLKERAEEDRTKAQGRFQDFYQIIDAHDRRITVLEVQQDKLSESLDEMKKDIKSGFKELQDELKELRKSG